MPEISTDLAARAARYIANHLVDRQLLVFTDLEGYQLALQLARTAGPEVTQTVRRQLEPLVRRSIDRGQQPPSGW